MDTWIKMYRSLVDTDLWLSEPFTKGQAWIDLVCLANHDKGFIRVHGVRIDLDRGDVGWSKLSLSKRWHWSRGKTHRFFLELKRDNRIDIKQDNKLSTVVAIQNYSLYQDKKQQTGQQNEQQTDNRQDTNKKDKNDKKIHTSKNSVTPCTEQELQEIATKLKVSFEAVKNKHAVILNKIEAREFKNKTVYLTLENWLIGDLDKGYIKRVTSSSIADKYKLYQPKAI